VKETTRMYEHFLAISIRNSGPDGLSAAIGNYNLGLFYCLLAREQATVNVQQTQLLLSKLHYEETHRIHLKILGPTHPETVDSASHLTAVTSLLSSTATTFAES
jgi:hypothetical protein